LKIGFSHIGIKDLSEIVPSTVGTIAIFKR
jgi:hypothetical protein